MKIETSDSILSKIFTFFSSVYIDAQFNNIVNAKNRA